MIEVNDSTGRIIAEEEILSCTAFIKKHWNLSALKTIHTEDLVRALFKKGLDASQHMFETHVAAMAMGSKIKERAAAFGESPTMKKIAVLDAAQSLCYEMMINLTSFQTKPLKENGDDFNPNSDYKKITSDFERIHPGLKDVFPLGYDKYGVEPDTVISGRYNDDFTGHLLGPTLDKNFHDAIDESNVSWLCHRHGYSPSEVLVMSIMIHAMGLNAHNNTVDCLQEIESLDIPTVFINGDKELPDFDFKFHVLSETMKAFKKEPFVFSESSLEAISLGDECLSSITPEVQKILQKELDNALASSFESSSPGIGM